MMKSDISEMTICEIKKMTAYSLDCDNCGWINSLEANGYYCPKCGKNLQIMTLESKDK